MSSSTLENRLGVLCTLLATIWVSWPLDPPALAQTALAQTARAQPAARQRIHPVRLRDDDASERFVERLVPGSHVKVFIPSLPYIYISHAINGAMIKPSDNARGWDYDMATSHRQLDDTTYEFKLRQGVQFQDGTRFDADAVVRNMDAFKLAPTLYSKIDQVFDRCEKV